jgi:hypothetical protein
MDIFFIEQADVTPKVSIDSDKGQIVITGKSLPEDSTAFFLPIENAIKEYISKAKQNTNIDLSLEYMNSSSQKRIIEILSLFEELINQQKVVNINWHYPDDDDDILDEGKDLAKVLQLPINFISM